MITHETKKTVQCSRSKIIVITHRVKKSHHQVHYLDKFSQYDWFSSHTFKFSGKFHEFFDEPGGMGRNSSIFEQKEVRCTHRLLLITALVTYATQQLRYLRFCSYICDSALFSGHGQHSSQVLASNDNSREYKCQSFTE